MHITHRRHYAAFSLIELMAVIAIMVILASMVVGGMGFVFERQAKEKARVQIALLTKAIEEYKLDNGSYPATENSVDGSGNTNILFNALYYAGAADATGATKIYLPELNPTTSKQGWTSGTATATTKIMDPWKHEYHYRSAVNSSGTANTNTQNPDFDLWSTGKDGVNDPGKLKDDIRNF